MKNSTYQRTPEDDYLHACLHEFCEFHYPQILAALGKIDRARNRLVDAQNELVHILNGLNNPYSTKRFDEFYAEGGVTARDWAAIYGDHHFTEDRPTPKIKGNGQLRVVRSEEKDDRV